MQEIGNWAPAVAISRCTATRERGGSWSFRAGGKQLADVKARSTRPAVVPGLYLWSGRQGDVRLEWLRIARWDGEMPSDVAVPARRTSTAPTARSSMAN